MFLHQMNSFNSSTKYSNQPSSSINSSFESDYSPCSLSRSKFSIGKSQSSISSSSSSNQSIECIAQARQIELEFSSCTLNPYIIRIKVPSGEESGPLYCYHKQSIRFSPSINGCGHGKWIISIEDESTNTISESSISLEGVGSLFFTIQSDMIPRITSQQFLHLPHSSLCSSLI